MQAAITGQLQEAEFIDMINEFQRRHPEGICKLMQEMLVAALGEYPPGKGEGGSCFQNTCCLGKPRIQAAAVH